MTIKFVPLPSAKPEPVLKPLDVPIWQVGIEDQQIRWNPRKEEFEFLYDEENEWERLDWEAWLSGGAEEVIAVLTNLLKLVKANQPPLTTTKAKRTLKKK